MEKNEIIIRLAGEGGEGVISTGDIFTQGAARTGYHVFTFRTYPAEIKGGHAWYQVRVGAYPVLSMGDGVDVMVAFNAEGYYNHKHLINKGGVLIYDPDTVTPEESSSVIAYGIPFNTIARKELDFFRGKNLIVTGFLAGLFGLEPSSLEGLIRSRFARRAELLASNLKSLYAGYEHATKKIEKRDPYFLTPVEKIPRLVLSGNDAIAAGALAAGCRFFAGYPITPASEILETMSKELPKLGGVSLQVEDEIAAIGMAAGASFGGLKSMTATSGPGLSLMSEFLGWVSMSETPCVIVDSQRAGPSTGMPTKLEQADLNHALYAGHGDFPRIVMAAGSVEDAFFRIIDAFNLSEKYQMPAIFLSDQSLSHRTESMLKPDLSRIHVEDRLRPTAEQLKDYRRYAVTESGASPMSAPGMAGGAYVAPGLEHDEKGHVDTPLQSHIIMMPKRFRKLDGARKDMGQLSRHGAADATIGVIGWGSTEGVIQEAVDRANASGHKVAALHPKLLSPLQVDDLRKFMDSVEHVIVPEVNYSGQFAHYLRSILGDSVVQLNKYGGLPFTPGEIFKKIEEVARNGNQRGNSHR
ncbi:MAG: 2-oxoacid:acceptor oxidoreductase subunit alpha [Dehalococcoidia bacterium]|nr:2-oxoacid:acceptor oxidoreductase subunit alpha [Dehalococcoidia bacterium]